MELRVRDGLGSEVDDDVGLGGVVIYLERADIEATLRVLEARSAPGSRLVVVYQSPSIVRKVLGLALRLRGEPFLSAFNADEMRVLLASFGFRVIEDDDLARIASRLSAEAEGLSILRSMRVATAERR